MTDETLDSWTEEASQLYQEIASIAVPDRAEQMATLLTLIPFSPDESFHAVEIAAGQGFLAAALLECFPQATLLALDGSPAMLAEIARRLEKYGARGSTAPFELKSEDWYSHLAGVDCVYSSLCVHHFSGPEKRAFFTTLGQRISPRGALLIADLVEPQRPEAQALFAATWDQNAQHQAQAQRQPELFDKFVRIEWNIYHFPDPMDQPSPLFDQLLWLKEAGFAVADCFWLRAGHAVYGGYKTPLVAKAERLPYELALQTVRRILGQE